MKTEMMMVTPLMAKKWLSGNRGNRHLRSRTVEHLRKAYESGEWKVTHQGIAISKSGRLIDGQHRLTFISLLPSGSKVPMNVSTDVDEEAFEAIDIGVRRNAADIYGVDKEFSASAQFVAKLANSSGNEGLTPQFVKHFMDWVKPEYDDLVLFSPSKRKMWSAASVRAAAILQMKRGSDPDFVKVTYHSLITQDVSLMNAAARALVNQYMSGKISSSRSLDLFCRAVRVFDSKLSAKNVNTIKVYQQGAILEEWRNFILSSVRVLEDYSK